MKGIRDEHRVVLVKIARSQPRAESVTALYEATRKWWVVAEARRGKGPASPEYALAVVRGRVVQAWRITGWTRAADARRWAFTGEPAGEVASLYQGLDVTPYFPPGAANPLRYVNCEGASAGAGAARPSDPQSLAARNGEIAGMVTRVMAEPLTHMLLGHRELCHSNLLAWFFESQADRADRVFGALARPAAGTGAARGVRREKDHLDLMLTWPDRETVVIENKVFSLPDEEQLARYGEKVASGGRAALYLLSLIDPSWPDDRKVIRGGEWRWLSFRELAGLIREAVPEADGSYEAQTMRRYASVVELLSDLVAEVVVDEPGEPVAMPSDVLSALGGRLGSALAKLRALSVEQRLRRALLEAGVRTCEVKSGYSKGWPLLEWFAPLGGVAGARSGWQLQDGQFRLAIVTPHLGGRDAAGRQARFAFASGREELFDFTHIDAALGTAGSPTLPSAGSGGRPGFNRFDPDFTYRYKKTPDLTVAQLEAAAVAWAKRTESLTIRPSTAG